MSFSEKDIFFPNHHNSFFIDEENTKDRFRLLCGYEKPTITHGEIKTKYNLQYIDFSELIFSPEYEVFYFHFENEMNRLLAELEQTSINEILNNLQQKDNIANFPEVFKKHYHFVRKYNVGLNDWYFFRLLACLLSLKFKKVVGYGFDKDKIIQVLHTFFDVDFASDCHMGKYVFHAIKFYGLRDFIIKQDRTKKFMAKAKKYQKKNFPQCTQYDRLLIKLFPEVFNAEQSH